MLKFENASKGDLKEESTSIEVPEVPENIPDSIPESLINVPPEDPLGMADSDLNHVVQDQPYLDFGNIPNSSSGLC